MRISLNSLGRLMGAVLLLCCSACGPHHLPDALTPEEHLDLGKAYEARGETERAQGQYTAAAATVPEGDFYLGNLAAATGQDAIALDYYRKAQPDMPDDPHLNNNLAWVLCRLGEKNNDKKQLQEASALARKALSAAPPDLKPLCEDTLRRTQQVLRGEAPAEKTLPPPRRRRARQDAGVPGGAAARPIAPIPDRAPEAAGSGLPHEGAPVASPAPTATGGRHQPGLTRPSAVDPEQ